MLHFLYGVIGSHYLSSDVQGLFVEFIPTSVDGLDPGLILGAFKWEISYKYSCTTVGCAKTCGIFELVNLC